MARWEKHGLILFFAAVTSAGIIAAISALADRRPAPPVVIARTLSRRAPINDLPMPEPTDPGQDGMDWTEQEFDPLYVQNIDVTDAERGDYINQLRESLAPDSEVWQECRRLLKLLEEGRLDEYEAGLRQLEEQLFKNTHFKIERIWRDTHNNQGCIDYVGATGARVSLPFPLEE
ncbi:MAG: hypothetical protein H6841_10070 [Planctomycetes bacterium]|nr:hypothetical protein [Planctomycetota bacterium]MCB9936018.1 hypothetical protein [Planctomycetota bacterium]